MTEALAPEDLLRGLHQSPPARLDPAAPAEAHSLVSHEHVPLYLFAIKSLARHWPLGVAAVVHDDGSLTEADVATLTRHVHGVRVIRRPEADAAVADALARHPLLASVRRHNVRLLQLVDYFLLARTDMVIGMDSDILFLDTPDELMRWRDDPGQRAAFRYSPERFANGRGPRGVHWIPEALPDEPYVPYMCCGFTCVRRGRFLDLDHVESLMARTPREILFQPRWVTQMFYSLLGGRLGTAAEPLGEPYRSGPWDWLPPTERRVLCHYFASHKSAAAHDNLTRLPDLFTRVLTDLTDLDRGKAATRA